MSNPRLYFTMLQKNMNYTNSLWIKLIFVKFWILLHEIFLLTKYIQNRPLTFDCYICFYQRSNLSWSTKEGTPLQACPKRWGRGGVRPLGFWPRPYCAPPDFWPRPLLLAPPDFQTLRHACSIANFASMKNLLSILARTQSIGREKSEKIGKIKQKNSAAIMSWFFYKTQNPRLINESGLWCRAYGSLIIRI